MKKVFAGFLAVALFLASVTASAAVENVLGVHHVRTSFDSSRGAEPKILVASSKGDLDRHRISEFHPDFTERYGWTWFQDRYLLVIELTEPSGSIMHNVADVTPEGDIVIERIMPDIGTSDMAQSFVIIEIDRRFRPRQYRIRLVE